ncbi:hypothetical protein OWM54_42890 [Myxococcus sp. MISCRS1]|uniref:hypothetical protein n=1 Tax=Myxococcus sp. MISCRS1 TaxID=2996786 RepID=UPI00226F59BC|nr:hypothetical protein [Myxococcus sp. MISCRS1]MCY1003912.1 hypothetical protein [Myxococcus sp. MISCRS1]
MTLEERIALATRLAQVEVELCEAQRVSDGSEKARRRICAARAEYAATEELVLRVLQHLTDGAVG